VPGGGAARRGVVVPVEAASPTLGRPDDAVATLLESGGAALLRRARRFSLCAADAEDALQRSIEILLTKGAAVDPRRLPAWMHVVVRREALAVRRIRERSIRGDTLDHVESDRPGPQEWLERRDRVAGAAALLRRLKPQERRAIGLQAQGYSYAEIQAITGWSYTKTNRCLAEGRARLRQLGAPD
jgi:RNA polymerase sigma factor (sigma-70 family)